MRYLLFQWSKWPHDYLKQALGEECVVVFSKDYKQRVLRYLSGSIAVLRKSSCGDVIICWYDAEAVVTWWLCRLFFLRREIVCLNLLLKQKNTFKNKVASWIYKQALTSNNFYATVTSNEYGCWLNEKLGIDVKYTLLRDVYHTFYEKPDLKANEGHEVFCGGCYGRDWDLMVEIASVTPDVDFMLVMQTKNYFNLMEKYGDRMPPNIHLEHNIPYKKFMKLLCQAKIVCMPLDSEAPQGLIVMFEGAANDKFILTSDNPTTRGYFDSSQLLGNNPEEWSERIKYYLSNDQIRLKKAQDFHDFLKKECSEEVFANTVREIVEKVEKKEYR